jgi:glycerol-3-phosphate dehydrogenase (NAD(P)+)
MNRVAVAGGGAWGCALATHAARAGHEVSLWVRDHPRQVLPDSVAVTTDLAALSGEVLLLAVPVQPMRGLISCLPALPVIACNKGMEVGSLRLPLEILAELRPELPCGVLSGPNFAHEVAAGQPAAAVVASKDAGLRASVRDLLSHGGFRLYSSSDPLGVQIGGAAKNVIAIAAGAVIGAGLGENARAGLVTRGLAELARLVCALGGRSETAFGLSGLGDLLLTCTGAASRNYSLGLRLGRGESLGSILGSRGSVTEGVATAPALVARGAGVELPICSAVAALVEGQTTVLQIMAEFFARKLRDE